jgi:hypothetical protein
MFAIPPPDRDVVSVAADAAPLAADVFPGDATEGAAAVGLLLFPVGSAGCAPPGRSSPSASCRRSGLNEKMAALKSCALWS